MTWILATIAIVVIMLGCLVALAHLTDWIVRTLETWRTGRGSKCDIAKVVR